MKNIKRLFLFFLFIIVSIYGEAQEIMAPVTAGPEYKKEIKKVVSDSKVALAFERIVELEESSNQNLILLTEIPAPPFKESIRAEKFAELLRVAGLEDVSIDEVGNVIGKRKGSGNGKVVALDAHLDTVFPEGTDVTVKYKGDTMLAPGIGDDTRGLVVILTALQAMNDAEIKTESDIWFIGTVGEEGLGDLRGVKHLFRDGAAKIDSWISVDGGGLGRLTNKGLGSKRYRVIFKGPGGHSWGAFGLANPHHALAQSVNIFVERADEFTKSGPRTSYNVGRIGGGTSVNSIPFESWMEVDMRSVDPSSLDSLAAIFKESMIDGAAAQNEIRRFGSELDVEIIEIGDRPSGEMANDAVLVQRAIAATNHFGINPQLGRGSTNSNTPISLGVPSVTIGRGGDGGNAHSLDEWWLNSNGAQAIQLALLLTVTEAGLAK